MDGDTMTNPDKDVIRFILVLLADLIEAKTGNKEIADLVRDYKSKF